MLDNSEMAPDAYLELLDLLDQRIKFNKNKPPPGDRRRIVGTAPEGMAERRSGEERRVARFRV